ncbi:MAG: DNA polymerase III subunit gamma/tau [Candidatus Omnitrophota bacterium]
MSYLVFALKWRPNNFDEVIGQGHIVNTLKSALQKNRLAHAYLFAGPRGVGKTSTARILAKALNCKEGPTVNPCGKCPSCLEITQGRSLDVIEIDGASNRGIDEIRTLRENVKFSPVQGKYKIYIIDEVHQITTDGFNALLKTLEEPPDFVKFIFATTQPNKVIPTILSRCQRLDFRRISVMEIVGQLEKIAATEKVKVDKEALLAVARSSDGALRDAESVLDQLIAFSKDKISLADVVSMMALVEQDTLFNIADKIIQKDPCSALSLFDGIINQGKDMGTFLTNLIEHFRNLMVAKVAQADPALIDLPQETCARLLEQSKAFSLEEIFSAFNILVNAQEISKKFDSSRIPIEISLVRLAHDKKEGAVGSLRPVHSPQIKSNPPKNTPEAKNIIKQEEDSPIIPPKAEKITSLENVKEAWHNVIGNLSKVKISVATYLNEGSPIKMDNNILTVSFPLGYSFHKESLESKENKAIIEKILGELLNNNLRINFILSKESPQREEGKTNPFIKSVLEVFEGRVIKEE